MSKKANPTVIGVFVLGAIALTILTLSLLGGGKIFSERESYIMYFDRSMKGLRDGANVSFRGVRIGQVRDVYVEIDPASGELHLPVIIEIEADSFRSTEGKRFKMSGPKSASMEELIDKGLRAILEMESVVTGQLLINLDFYPDSPLIYRSTKEHEILEEIPTIPSEIQRVLIGIQKFASKLEHIEIDKLVSDMAATVEGVENLVNAPELMNTIKGIDRIINDQETQKLTSSIQNTLSNLDSAMTDIKRLVTNVDQQVEPIVSELLQTMQTMHTAIDEVQGTFTDIRTKVNDETIRYELSTAINELSNAARSFRIFVDYLERHPESFITGKPEHSK